jgi:hypothetical protein
MQSSAARKLETLEEQRPLRIPAEVIPLRPSIREQKEEGIKRTLTEERKEEIVGVIFLTAAFFLSGWFYYLLYQAMRSYEVF